MVTEMFKNFIRDTYCVIRLNVLIQIRIINLVRLLLIKGRLRFVLSKINLCMVYFAVWRCLV
jgi:hypothetical protein